MTTSVQPFETDMLEHVHTDTRRSIYEVNGSDFSIQRFFIIADNLPLGNHYHKGKEETFLITKGGGKVALLALDETGEPIAEQKQQIGDLVEGSVVKVRPYTVHTFMLAPGSTMICFSSVPFDEQNKDLNFYELTFQQAHPEDI